MNQELAILKGRLAGLKDDRMRIETAIQADLAAVQTMLTGWRVTPIANINIEAAHHHLQNAANLKKTLMDVREDIRKIEEDLA